MTGRPSVDSHTSASGQSAVPPSGGASLDELRRLLVGAERADIEAIKTRLEELQLSPEKLGELLPEAVIARARRDGQLGKALMPTVEEALKTSVKRSPQTLADAIFPVLGPAIRKAIAQAVSGLVEALNTAAEHSLTLRGLRWRTEAWRAGVPFGQVVMRHTLLCSVEQVYLIHRETGLLLCHVSSDQRQQQDADLVSSMLAAIKDFAADSFGTPSDRSGLRAFTVGDLVVWVEQGPDAILAAALRGHPPAEARTMLQDALETAHLEYGEELSTFDGDAASFESARPVLESCLRVELKDEKGTGRSPVLIGGLILLLLGLSVWGVRALWSERIWDRFVAQVRDQPGLVLVDAGGGGGSRYITGLRDPHAADPHTLMPGAGLDGVTLTFEPYLSLHPEIIARRAREALGAPASVILDVRGDTLFAGGSAADRWIRQARERAPSVVGVGSLVTDGLENTDVTGLRAAADTIERARIDFASGSATLSSASRDSVLAVSDLISSLLSRSEILGMRVAVELLGRADSIGAETRNVALSRARARAVRAALVRSGIPPGALTAVGLGSREPLATTGEDVARVNRTVAFRVALEAAGVGSP